MSTVRVANIQHPSAATAAITLDAAGGALIGGLPTANRNRIINGGFDVWQRGTSFTNPQSSSNIYTADRWCLDFANANPTSASITQQAFVPGNPIAGYEPSFFARSTITTVGATTIYRPFTQRIEDVRTFAGQQATLSFWAKADSARSLNVYWLQNFGAGGSATNGSSEYAFILSTTWTRYSVTFTPTSISGKTIGAGSYLAVLFQQAAASGSVLDIWGVQLEVGAVATPFEFKSYGQELTECQRYFYILPGGVEYGGSLLSMEAWANPLVVNYTIPRMRVTPSATGSMWKYFTSSFVNPSSFALQPGHMRMWGGPSVSTAVLSSQANFSAEL